MLSIQTLRDRGGGGGSLLPPEQNWRWPPDAEGTPEEPPNPPSYSHPCAPITTLQKPPPQAEPPAPGCTHAWLHTRTPCMQLCTHVRASPRTHTALQCTHRACNRFARCRRRTACFVCPFFSFLFPFPACIFFRLKTNPCILLLLPLSLPAINSKERCFLPTKIPAFQYSKKKGEVKGGGGSNKRTALIIQVLTEPERFCVPNSPERIRSSPPPKGFPLGAADGAGGVALQTHDSNTNGKC